MRYAGMSMGMWALFAPSFRNQRIGSKARNRKVPGFFVRQKAPEGAAFGGGVYRISSS